MIVNTLGVGEVAQGAVAGQQRPAIYVRKGERGAVDEGKGRDPAPVIDRSPNAFTVERFNAFILRWSACPPLQADRTSQTQQADARRAHALKPR